MFTNRLNRQDVIGLSCLEILPVLKARRLVLDKPLSELVNELPTLFRPKQIKINRGVSSEYTYTQLKISDMRRFADQSNECMLLGPASDLTDKMLEGEEPHRTNTTPSIVPLLYWLYNESGIDIANAFIMIPLAESNNRDHWTLLIIDKGNFILLDPKGPNNYSLDTLIKSLRIITGDSTKALSVNYVGIQPKWDPNRCGYFVSYLISRIISARLSKAEIFRDNQLTEEFKSMFVFNTGQAVEVFYNENKQLIDATVVPQIRDASEIRCSIPFNFRIKGNTPAVSTSAAASDIDSDIDDAEGLRLEPETTAPEISITAISPKRVPENTTIESDIDSDFDNAEGLRLVADTRLPKISFTTVSSELVTENSRPSSSTATVLQELPLLKSSIAEDLDRLDEANAFSILTPVSSVSSPGVDLSISKLKLKGSNNRSNDLATRSETPSQPFSPASSAASSGLGSLIRKLKGFNIRSNDLASPSQPFSPASSVTSPAPCLQPIKGKSLMGPRTITANTTPTAAPSQASNASSSSSLAPITIADIVNSPTPSTSSASPEANANSSPSSATTPTQTFSYLNRFR